MNILREKLKEIECMARNGMHKIALEKLNELCLLDPLNALVWASRAYVNGQGGQRMVTVDDWTQSPELNDKEPHYFYMRGIDLFAIKR